MAARTTGFAVCIRNKGFGASLDLRKLYPVVQDTRSEANGLIRIVDESGEGYLYPASMFRKLTLPVDLKRVLRAAS